MSDRDWLDWHSAYDRPDSSLRRRLQVVQDQVAHGLDRCPPGPIRVVSLCAGQGRDLLPVLAGHPRREDVTARLVELDERNVQIAVEAVRELGLDQAEVVAADASVTDVCEGVVPAGLVLACGIFGNISDADIRRTISFLPELCTQGATVIWTRGRWEPDITPSICRWFEDHGFEELAIIPPLGPADFGVGVHRYAGLARTLRPGERMFTFIGRQDLHRR
jgi:hypothetical protein